MLSETQQKIKTIIIDKDKNFLFSLKDDLSLFPEIEVLGTTSQWRKAKKFFIKEKPDLVFISPDEIELLNELKKEGINGFSIVFCATNNDFLLQALHESALDFFLKPIKQEELKAGIERYKKRKKVTIVGDNISPANKDLQVVPLPTLTGLQFLRLTDIILFRFIRQPESSKSYSWQVLLRSFNKIRLKKSTTAKEILEYMGHDHFMQVNQSAIVNMTYLRQIEYKTKICKLIAPYDKIKLTVSRSFLSSVKKRFDRL